jgi:hypothetical protein
VRKRVLLSEFYAKLGENCLSFEKIARQNDTNWQKNGKSWSKIMKIDENHEF